MTRAIAAFLMLLAAGSAAVAQGRPSAAEDTQTIEDCIKSAAPAGKAFDKAESCIGVIASPCLKDDKTRSTADMVACSAREHAVWDDILNETYRRLSAKLDDKQKIKLRDMQRAWIVSRDKACAFYWDYFQGTMASPMTADCLNRETARRAIFLLGFLFDSEGR